jgi:hypothetical protein
MALAVATSCRFSKWQNVSRMRARRRLRLRSERASRPSARFAAAAPRQAVGGRRFAGAGCRPRRGCRHRSCSADRRRRDSRAPRTGPAPASSESGDGRLSRSRCTAVPGPGTRGRTGRARHGGAFAISPSSTCDHSLVQECRAELAAGGRCDKCDASLLGESTLEQPPVDAEALTARVRLLVLGERCAPVVLALLSTPAAAAGAAPAPVLAGWLRLPAAVAAPLGWGWLRRRAWE